MLVNIEHDTPAEHRRLLVAGVVFVTVLATLVGISIAIYQKVFTPVTMITVKADRAGLQLSKFGDVRVHGVLVGHVRSVDQDGKQASIRIALKPEAAKAIPENVDVRILPTTLFGQKYVDLVDPAVPARASLTDGTVIPASRVSTNVELQQILANLFPLLRSIRPADLSTTLTSIADALDGRGEQIGRTLDDLDEYLTALNPHLPTLQADLAELAKVAKTYQLAAPDLVRLLGNATTTARTVSTMEKQLGTFFRGLTTVAETGGRVLSENEEAIVAEGKLAVPLLGLLDTYSPEFPCLLKGTARFNTRLDEIFTGGVVRQTMALDAKQRPPYSVKDKPVYGDIGRGPQCHGLPYPQVPFPGVDLNNGSDQDAQ